MIFYSQGMYLIKRQLLINILGNKGKYAYGLCIHRPSPLFAIVLRAVQLLMLQLRVVETITHTRS